MILRVVYSFTTMKSPTGKPSYEFTEIGAYYIDMGKTKPRPTLREMEKYARRDAGDRGYDFAVISWQEVTDKEVREKEASERVFVWEDEEIIGA